MAGREKHMSPGQAERRSTFQRSTRAALKRRTAWQRPLLCDVVGTPHSSCLAVLEHADLSRSRQGAGKPQAKCLLNPDKHCLCGFSSLRLPSKPRSRSVARPFLVRWARRLRCHCLRHLLPAQHPPAQVGCASDVFAPVGTPKSVTEGRPMHGRPQVSVITASA